MTVKFSNNASATLASSINASVTSIQVTAGQGAQFPTLSAGDYFFATLVDSSNNMEIVKVTARSSDTLTVVRAQESTAARAYLAGDKIECRVTAAGLTAIYTDSKTYTDTTAVGAVTAHTSNPTGAHAASAISVTPTGGVASTTVQAAIAELDSEKADKTATVTGSAGITATGNLGSGVAISPTAGYNGHGVRTVSTSAPSGGNDGDIWYQVA
jgi:hypothetical protein